MYAAERSRKPLNGFKNQNYENPRKIIGTNPAPKTTVLNRNNNNNNNNSNNTNRNSGLLAKRIGIPKSLDNPYPPAYARPTIATTARGMSVTKMLVRKSLTAATSNKNSTTFKEESVKNSAKPKPQQVVERLAGGELAHNYNSSKYEHNIKKKFNDNKEDILVDVDTQTNEEEIKNHELIVGDVKLMLPSPSVITAIEQERKEQRRLEHLQAMRKIDAHTEKQSLHLTDLKEFLETSTVSRRNRKPSTTNPKTLNKTKPDVKKIMMQPKINKGDSVLSIKSRIKQKERELLSLFDNVEKM